MSLLNALVCLDLGWGVNGVFCSTACLFWAGGWDERRIFFKHSLVWVLGGSGERGHLLNDLFGPRGLGRSVSLFEALVCPQVGCVGLNAILHSARGGPQ